MDKMLSDFLTDLVLSQDSMVNIYHRRRALEILTKAKAVSNTSSVEISVNWCGAISRGTIPQADMTEIGELIHNNRVIEAIKIIRRNTGWGLAESKRWVDGAYKKMPFSFLGYTITYQVIVQ